MSNVKTMKTVQSETRPTFNEWCKEFNVSGKYEVKDTYVVKTRLKPKELTLWEKIKNWIVS